MAMWTVKTYHKKNVQEVEHWVRSEGSGKFTVTNGFRWGEWTVETSDDNPPKFEFTYVPNGNKDKDSINMLDCEVNNIQSVELVTLDDGGCWYDIEFEGLSEEEEEELQEFIDENSVYELEDRDDSWYQDETEWWIWGPIEITNDQGYSRIIVADKDGNVTDYIDSNSIEVLPELAPIIVETVAPKLTEDQEVTEWFPSDIKPAYEGKYQIFTEGTEAWPFNDMRMLEWKKNKWIDDEGFEIDNKTFKSWRGLAKNPNAIH